MENRKARFDALRERWNKVSADTIKEIEEVLKEKEGHRVEIDRLTLMFSGSNNDYEDLVVEAFIDEYDDVYIKTEDGEICTLGELSTGEELWLLWELI